MDGFCKTADIKNAPIEVHVSEHGQRDNTKQGMVCRRRAASIHATRAANQRTRSEERGATAYTNSSPSCIGCLVSLLPSGLYRRLRPFTESTRPTRRTGHRLWSIGVTGSIRQRDLPAKLRPTLCESYRRSGIGYGIPYPHHAPKTFNMANTERYALCLCICILRLPNIRQPIRF